MACSNASTSLSVEHPFEPHFSAIKTKCVKLLSIVQIVQMCLNFLYITKDICFLHFIPHLHTNVSYPLICACILVLGTIILPSFLSHKCKLFICFPFNVSIFAHAQYAHCFFIYNCTIKILWKALENKVCNTDFLFSVLLLICPFFSCCLAIIP